MKHSTNRRSRRLPLDLSAPALCLALIAGLPLGLPAAAQDSQPPQGEEQPGDPREPDRAGEVPPPEDSPLRRAWSQFRGAEDPQPGEATPIEDDTRAQPRRVGIQAEQPPATTEQPVDLEPPAPDEVFTIDLVGEPVQLGSLIDLISNRLRINIFSDPGVMDRSVTFNGPMRIEARNLLDFLSLLVEQQGFALTREREGWYVIRPAGEVAFNLEDGDLATTRIIPTPLLRPSALKTAIDAALASRAQASNVANRIAYIDELGIIIITDTPRGLRSVEQVVNAVVAEAMAQKHFRIEIKHIHADLARSKIIELNGAQSTRTTQGQTRNPNQPIAQGPVATPSGALTNLTERLILDDNALIFRGTEQEYAALRALIEAVDTPSKLIAKRYPAGPASPAICSYGERRGLGPVTTGPSTSGGQQGFTGGSFNQRQFAANQQQGSSTGAGFVIEDNQEAFVYFGTEEQHAQVAELVEAFADQARLARVVVEFYPLRHADAEDVADLLNSIVQDTSQQFGESPFLPSPTGSRRNNRVQEEAPPVASEVPSLDNTSGGDSGEQGVSLTPSENLSIQPDISRNQVIIKAPIRQQAEFANIIQRLDVRRPQVYIEAKIVSVTTTDRFRFGVDWDVAIGSTRFFTNFGLLSLPVQAPGVNDPTLVGVIDSGDAEVVINALASVGETRILSSPRILVKDNEEAEILSTREEPYSSTTQNAGTAVTAQGGVAEAGTTLTVTPQISEGGLVNLEFAIELSDFDLAQQQTGLQPPKQKDEYNSVVTLPSDSTLIIGGLTFNREADSVEKIPLLGDLPIIGQAFRQQSSVNVQTTVFVFIRPVIVRDEAMTDLRLLTEGPRKIIGLPGDTPDLEPERIPIRSGSLGSSYDRPVRVRTRANDPS